MNRHAIAISTMHRRQHPTMITTVRTLTSSLCFVLLLDLRLRFFGSIHDEIPWDWKSVLGELNLLSLYNQYPI